MGNGGSSAYRQAEDPAPEWQAGGYSSSWAMLMEMVFAASFPRYRAMSVQAAGSCSKGSSA